MTEKHFSFRRLDPYAAISPDISATFANAANSISPECVPAIGGVACDVAGGNWAEPKAEGANPPARGRENVMKPAARHGRTKRQQNHSQAQHNFETGDRNLGDQERKSNHWQPQYQG